MLHVGEAIAFIVILALTVYGFFNPLYLRYRLIRLGKAENRYDRPWSRVLDAVTSFFFLRCSVKKERTFTGIVHVGFLYGSLTFDTVSVGHIVEGFKEGFRLFGSGTVGHLYSLWVDIFAILVLLALAYFVVKRYIVRPKTYTYPSVESVIIYLLLFTVTITFLLYEGAMIALHPDHGLWAFVGKALAGWLGGAYGSRNTAEVVARVFWWVHILNVFAFVVYVPRSKYLHMIFGPINIAFRNQQIQGVVTPLDIEDEEAESFGVEQLPDFTWRDLFDGFACVDCGRCDDYCPAQRTEKPLSPKNIMLQLKDGLLRDGKKLISNPKAEVAPLMEQVFSAGEIWSCTTCGACMHVCPVKNEHVPKLIGLRQGQVLMQSAFPSELKRMFKGLNTNANPWGLGANVRLEWAKDLDIPRFDRDEAQEYLLYLGCAASFDDRAQMVGGALINFLKQHDISFGILGEGEQCCGETARRLGEESVGQMLIEANKELFDELGVRKILTACPHCYNTFKKEYPAFGGNYEVVHHSQLISELVLRGEVTITGDRNERVAIHDSCYMGRVNGVYEPPRHILQNVRGVTMLEHSESKEWGFCCGAGGGRFWLEEEGTRINHERVGQLATLKPDVIATSCPYCLRMLEDGVKDLGEERIQVRDLVEIVVGGSRQNNST
jgi:Fe-S oxidoreductase